MQKKLVLPPGRLKMIYPKKTITLRMVFAVALAAALLCLAACDKTAGQPVDEPARPDAVEPAPEGQADTQASEGDQTMPKPTESVPEEPVAADEPSAAKALTLTIGGTPVTVEWEDNASVEALWALAEGAPLTIQLSMYGGFEQVGPIGQSLPRDDKQTTTAAGDIVLYSGNQIVIFYGSNSWAYTRLGHIADKSAAEMAALLGNGNVAITLTVE